ncbi:MAG: hypothetical protein QM658_11845 [Gordonia sp. (in: high G+C Gram-positive bacteria)]
MDRRRTRSARRRRAHGVPMFGVCFGGQLLADVLGGSALPGLRPEYGFTPVQTDDPLLVGPGPWFEFHHDVIAPPPGARVVARTASGVQAFTSGPHLGVQFHPEATLECLRAWRRRPSGTTADDEGGVDVAALEAELVAHSDRSAARCDQLVASFLRHAGLT